MVDASPAARINELTELGKFIEKHSRSSLDRDIGWLVADAGQSHDAWAGACPVGHMFDDVPCLEWDRATSLGISWLKSRIEEGRHAS